MDSEARAGRKPANRRADKGIDAGGVAHGVAGVEPGRQLAAVALELVAGGLARHLGVAALRHGPTDARREPALAQEMPDRQRPGDRSARRMEIDRQLAPAEAVEQRAQALR